MQKSDLLNWLHQEQQEWEALLTQVGSERMEQPGVNAQWSMKDLVAHQTGWNRRLAAYMQAAQRGEPEPAPPWPTHLQNDDDIMCADMRLWVATHGRMVILRHGQASVDVVLRREFGERRSNGARGRCGIHGRQYTREHNGVFK